MATPSIILVINYFFSQGRYKND